MKHLAFIILENSRPAEEALFNLSKQGFNGTVLPSSSLKHALDNDGEIPMFINLSHLEHIKYESNLTIYIVINEEDIPVVKEIIGKATNYFKNCHGGMFIVPLESYEGSF